MDDITRCNGTGVIPGEERWWVWLTTSGAIYIVVLLTILTYYSIYYLVKWLRGRHTSPADEREDNSAAKYEINGETADETDNGEKEKHHRILSRTVWRKFARKLTSGDTIISKLFITFILSCNLIYMILAFQRTYSPIEEYFILSQSPARIVELVVVIFLILFSLIRLFASNTLIQYWVNLHTIVDVFTLPHIFVSIALGQDWLGLRSLRFIWLTQVLDVIRFLPFIHSQDVIDLVALLFNFLILWLAGAGMVHLLEGQGDPWNDRCPEGLSFLEYCYFVMVTFSTVGYGDIGPQTDWGRAFVTFFIIAGLALFASILPALAEVASNYYQKTQYAKFDSTRVPKHVIVCGHITNTSASEFLNDFLHPDRGDTNTHVLFLDPNRPDNDLKAVLRSFYTRVQYIVGSVLNGKDLVRAKINTSSACFIIANKHCNNPIEEDNANLLRLVSVKNTTDKVPIIIQLLHSSSKAHVYNIDGWKEGRDIAISLNELKLGLLGQSCVSPGFSTLIANLFYTSDFPKLKFLGQDNWQTLYIKGASNEIYSTTFSYTFHDISYHDAAQICYRNFGLILLALEDTSNPREPHIYINPSSSLTIKAGKRGMLGYFIGQDQKHVQIVSTYCERCHGDDEAGDDRERVIKRLSGRKCKCKDTERDKEPAATELTQITIISNRTNGYESEPLLAEQDNLESLKVRRPSMHTCKLSSIDSSIVSEFETIMTESSSCPTSGHIVLCVFTDEKSAPLGLHNFIRPLRTLTFSPDELKPVVIISQKAFLEKEWLEIGKYPKIHLVLGSPLYNLDKANVAGCDTCVILTANTTTDGHELAVIDKEAVLCSLSIQKKYNQKVHVITDLQHEANVQFLDFGDEDQPDERIYKAQPFACGEAFSISMFDSVTSSAYHGPGTVSIIKKLIHTSDAGSSSISSSCQVVAKQLEEWSDKTFGELYKDYLTNRSVCLAIFRQLSSDSQKHYVITAPDSKLKLKNTDIAFVMVGTQEQEEDDMA